MLTKSLMYSSGDVFRNVHHHLGMSVVLAGLSLTVSFPDHTQMLTFTNYWGIAVFFFFNNALGHELIHSLIQSNSTSFEGKVPEVSA